tara:strand:- start:1053 stop:1277 length:225 start_codon:yes stop_codon:yes gene_type:complete
MIPHRYGLRVNHMGVDYEIGAGCFPCSEDGFEMKVIVKSPVPKKEMPVEVVELWEEWLADVKSDYFLKAVDVWR